LNTADHNPLREEPTAGSLSSGEPVFLAVGKLRRSHGVKGEMVMDIFTDFPERLKTGVRVFIGAQHTEQRIRSQRPNGSSLLIAFQGFSTPESVAELRNQVVFVRADDRPPLPEGEYYHHQLLGLRVVDEGGQTLGKLVEILSSPANDVYIVQPEAGTEILLPALKSVILNVDLEQRVMRVHLLPGLIPE
jgi:16S rRNA processing protein RimM